jgi:hypothetical protein
MVLVESGHIYDIDFDEDTSVLSVTFNDQSRYEYTDVPFGLYQEFMAAPSKSTFFRAEIKGKFPYEKVG